MAKSGPEMRSTHVIFSLVERPFYENVPRSVKIILQNFKNFLSLKIWGLEGRRARGPGVNEGNVRFGVAESRHSPLPASLFANAARRHEKIEKGKLWLLLRPFRIFVGRFAWEIRSWLWVATATPQRIGNSGFAGELSAFRAIHVASARAKGIRVIARKLRELARVTREFPPELRSPLP